jgi:arsenical pump membrane protein
MWWASLVAAGLALVTRWLPAGEAESILRRIAPVLVFLVAITVVAQLAQNAGVFDAAAHLAARIGRGRTWVLWLLMVTLATASTIVLSLDTTAVLLTPVALALAVQIGISPALFAMTTVWLADTASMLLPVSNLTNLLALHRLHDLGLDLGGYVALTWLPALVAVLVTVACARRTSHRASRRWRTGCCSGVRPPSACSSGRPSRPGSSRPGRPRSPPSRWSLSSRCAGDRTFGPRTSPGGWCCW